MQLDASLRVMIGDEGAVEINCGDDEEEEEQEQEYKDAMSISSSSTIDSSSSSFAMLLLPLASRLLQALPKTEAIGVAPADKSGAGSHPGDASVWAIV